MGQGNETVLEQIETYFQCDDDEDDLTLNEDPDPSASRNTTGNHSIPTLDILSQRFTAYQTQLRSPVTVEKSLEVYESANQFLKEWDWMDTELDQKVRPTDPSHCASPAPYPRLDTRRRSHRFSRCALRTDHRVLSQNSRSLSHGLSEFDVVFD